MLGAQRGPQALRPSGWPPIPRGFGPLGSRASAPYVHPDFARPGSVLWALRPSGRPPPPWTTGTPRLAPHVHLGWVQGFIPRHPPRLRSSGKHAVGFLSGCPHPRPPGPRDPSGPGVGSPRPPGLHSSGERAVGLTSGWAGLPRASLWRASLHISLVPGCGWTQGPWEEPACCWVPSPFLCPRGDSFLH